MPAEKIQILQTLLTSFHNPEGLLCCSSTVNIKGLPTKTNDFRLFTMFSRCLRSTTLIKAVGKFSRPSSLTSASSIRSFSSQLPPDDPQAQFKTDPPKELNMEMAEGIQDANKLILKYGVGKQRLKILADDESMPLTLKWQRMMEIYLGAQLHVIAALGYDTNEQGIMMFTQQLAEFVGKSDPDTQEKFRKLGKDTWRGMLASAFDLDDALLEEKCGETMSIVDARNTVHKVASKLMEPEILESVAKRCAELPPGKLERKDKIS